MSERKLTKDEQSRFDNYLKVEEEYLSKGYKKAELLLDEKKTNIIANVASIPIILVGIVLYFFVRKGSFNFNGLLFFVGIFASIFIHEGIHGLTWATFSQNHFKDISFGIIKEQLMPYCNCKAPLNKKHYLLGSAMPLIVLGIIVTIIGFVADNYTITMIGLVNIASAMGDILVIYKILTYKTDAKEIIYIDHPTKIGGVIFEK